MKVYVELPPGTLEEKREWLERVNGLVCHSETHLVPIGALMGRAKLAYKDNAPLLHNEGQDNLIVSVFVKNFLDEGFIERIVIEAA